MMAQTTKIEWCDHTFNPWRGCTKVHAGCQNCYAEARAETLTNGLLIFVFVSFRSS